jgi:hypothetical protein
MSIPLNEIEIPRPEAANARNSVFRAEKQLYPEVIPSQPVIRPQSEMVRPGTFFVRLNVFGAASGIR